MDGLPSTVGSSPSLMRVAKRLQRIATAFATGHAVEPENLSFMISTLGHGATLLGSQNISGSRDEVNYYRTTLEEVCVMMLDWQRRCQVRAKAITKGLEHASKAREWAQNSGTPL